MKLKNKTVIIRKINNIGINQYCHPFVPIPSEYRMKWSRLVKKRDKRRCQICGTKKSIVSHHIIYKIHYPKLALLTNNGITLCKSCEDQAHGRELQQFMPKHIRVPSLKMMIRKVPRRAKFLRRFKKISRLVDLHHFFVNFLMVQRKSFL